MDLHFKQMIYLQLKYYSSDLMVTPKQDTTECIEAAVILSSLRSLFNYEVYEDR